MDKDIEELDLYTSMQILALQEFLEPTEESFHRKLTRWFSKEFHTSIFDVEKRPIEYILQHYYEHTLDQMSKEDLEKHKRFLLHKEEVLEQEEEDEDFVNRLELELLKKNQAELDKKNVKREVLPDIVNRF